MLRAQRVAAEAREDAAKGRALDEEEASRDVPADVVADVRRPRALVI